MEKVFKTCFHFFGGGGKQKHSEKSYWFPLKNSFDGEFSAIPRFDFVTKSGLSGRKNVLPCVPVGLEMVALIHWEK